MRLRPLPLACSITVYLALAPGAHAASAGFESPTGATPLEPAPGPTDTSSSAPPEGPVDDAPPAAPVRDPDADVAAPTQRETQNGLGLLITGSVLTGIGAPVTIAGTVGLAAIPVPYNLVFVPFLGAGVAHLAVGIPLLVVGVKRRKRWKAANVTTTRLVPGLGRSPQGTWTPGLTLRF